jgi:primosomal protein N' (replication factor Y)
MKRSTEGEGLLGSFAVPLRLRGLFTYRIPPGLEARARPGMRALLPVGKGTRVGYLVETGVRPTLSLDRLRDVERFLDDAPAFDPSLLRTLLDAARYYHHPEGLVLETALPPDRASAGPVRYVLTAAGRRALQEGVRQELDARVLGLLAGGAKTLVQLARHAPLVGPQKMEELVERGLAAEDEGGARRGTRVLKLERLPAPGERPPGKVGRKVLEALERKDGVALCALRKSLPVPDASVRALVRRGFVSVQVRDGAERLEAGAVVPEQYAHPPERLTAHQRDAVAAVNNAVATGGFRPFLLHGVTGSGKTEVYLRAIGSVLERGRSAVVLVPEIALTPQLVAMFRSRVGEEIAVLHSALPPARRRATWEAIRSGRRRVVIGARSAVFAPVADPGIFIVDEEHDSSFKQGEGFRYSARDLALLRAQRQGAAAILGSATPSIETYQNAMRGKLSLLTLPDRATTQPLPEVQVVDLRVRRHGPAGQGYISQVLYDAMKEAIGEGGQVILFLNRRGFAPSATCTACGEPVRCPACSVALVHHRFTGRLSCHYCGHSQDVPASCPSCSADGEKLELRGPGTERIEQIVGDVLPSARILRMDSDVASGAAAEPILAAMREGEADVLVGTQMVTKGHDLPRVALVGVVRADMGLGMPDFRAAERTFQLLTQVAGRAGRGDAPGRVVLQTYNPEHPCLAAARAQNYGAFFGWELENRRATGYPPFTHLALIRFSGKDEQATARAASEVDSMLSGGAVRVLGPVPSPLARLRGRYRWQILLKAATRKQLHDLLEDVPDESWARSMGVRLRVDVDPVDFL